MNENGGIVEKGHFLVLSLFFAQLNFCADDLITIHNKTDDTIFVRIYCEPIFSNGKAQAGDLYEIPVNGSQQLIRPEKQMNCTRHLAFARDRNLLAKELSKKSFQKLASIGIGLTTAGRMFDNFYVTSEKGFLKGFNTLTWHPYQLLFGYEQSLLKDSALVKSNPYKDRVAQIRIGTDVCPEEKEYLKKRELQVKIALEKFLGKNLNGSFIPKIAFINSGGGARALISSLGWHIGAQEIGLLDAVTYDIGLSGGSWFISCWLVSGKQPSEFKQLMQPLMNKELYPSGNRFSPDELKEFFNALMIRDALHQPTTLVNLWGALLANRYLAPYGSKRQEMLFSTLGQQLDGNKPLPIVTAISGHISDLRSNRKFIDWFEITPFEVGAIGDWLGNAHIPTWGFGRVYDKKGVSKDNNPQYDIGLIMGICGSAFAISYARTYEETIKAGAASITMFETSGDKIADMIIDKFLPEDIQKLAIEKRLSVAKVPNFAKDVSKSMVKDEQLRLVDAGIAFNLPIPPALERKADMLILFDASESVKMAPELQVAEQYIRARGYKFPSLIFDGIEKRPATIFVDEKDKQVPVVVYMPNTDPTGKLNTSFDVTKFNYSPAEFNMLSGVTESNMKASKELIKKALIDLIERHNGFE